MLDRTIRFYNTILKCNRYEVQKVILPDGFEIVSYHAGDEKAWAKLECSISNNISTYVAPIALIVAPILYSVYINKSVKENVG